MVLENQNLWGNGSFFGLHYMAKNHPNLILITDELP